MCYYRCLNVPHILTLHSIFSVWATFLLLCGIYPTTNAPVDWVNIHIEVNSKEIFVNGRKKVFCVRETLAGEKGEGAEKKIALCLWETGEQKREREKKREREREHLHVFDDLGTLLKQFCK